MRLCPHQTCPFAPPSPTYLCAIKVFRDAQNLRTFGHRASCLFSLRATVAAGGASMASVGIRTLGRATPCWRLNSGGSGPGQWEQG